MLEEEEVNLTSKHSKWLRLCYSAILFIAHFSIGLITSQMGSAMVDLRYLMNGNVAKEIATTQAITLQSTALSAGAFLGGTISFIYKWPRISPYLNRQLLGATLLVLAGIANSLVTQTATIYWLYVLAFTVGFSGGNIMAVGITWLCELWTGRLLAAFLQALQLSFGVGAIFGPLIAGPFLYGHMNDSLVEVMNETQYWEVIEVRRSSLTVPYAISGAVMGTAGLGLLLLYIPPSLRYLHSIVTAKPKNQNEALSKLETSTCKRLESPAHQTRLRLFIALVFFQFACSNVGEFSYATFLDTFLQSLKDVHVSAPEAAHVASIYATSYTIGRAASIFISMLIPAANLLLVHYTLILVGLTAFLFTTQIGLLWIQLNAVLIGYGFSATIPAIFTYVNVHSDIVDHRNALYSIALHTPSIFTPLLIGPYIDQFPAILLYLDLTVVTIAFLIFLVVRFKIVL